jgi:2-oxo-4-hydroxy-4-carboxy--5-ureidoimidazoline (OHCU) decarboxylase
MVDERPFKDVAELLSKADGIWWALEADDWLAAFRSHPKIGEQKAAERVTEQAQAWSELEQAGARGASAEAAQALAEGNREYEQRFGHTSSFALSAKPRLRCSWILLERLPTTRIRSCAWPRKNNER